jgi:hypothetical protein
LLAYLRAEARTLQGEKDVPQGVKPSRAKRDAARLKPCPSSRVCPQPVKDVPAVPAGLGRHFTSNPGLASWAKFNQVQPSLRDCIHKSRFTPPSSTHTLSEDRVSGIPYLAKNERDMGHPGSVGG